MKMLNHSTEKFRKAEPTIAGSRFFLGHPISEKLILHDLEIVGHGEHSGHTIGSDIGDVLVSLGVRGDSLLTNAALKYA